MSYIEIIRWDFRSYLFLLQIDKSSRQTFLLNLNSKICLNYFIFLGFFKAFWLVCFIDFLFINHRYLKLRNVLFDNFRFSYDHWVAYSLEILTLCIFLAFLLRELRTCISSFDLLRHYYYSFLELQIFLAGLRPSYDIL